MYDKKYVEEWGEGPHLAVDAMVVNDLGQVLLVQRLDSSFALPGGFLDVGETLLEGAKREVFEETGLRFQKGTEPVHMGVSDDPKRDRRAHIVTVAYMFEVEGCPKVKSSSESLSVGWFRMEEIKKLRMYSDHYKIILGLTQGYISEAIPLVLREAIIK